MYLDKELAGWSHLKSCSQQIVMNSDILQRSVLEQMLFNIFVDDMDNGIGCILSQLVCQKHQNEWSG